MTYAGHPLYVFHADAPFAQFQGEGFLETVLPCPPGMHCGTSCLRRTTRSRHATVETEALVGGKRVLAVDEFPTSIAALVTVYPLAATTGLQRLHWSALYVDPGPHNRSTSCRFGRRRQGPWCHPPARGHRPGDV